MKNTYAFPSLVVYFFLKQRKVSNSAEFQSAANVKERGFFLRRYGYLYEAHRPVCRSHKENLLHDFITECRFPYVRT